MRNIRITLDDKDANILDEIRKENDCTYKDLLLVNVRNKKKRHKKEDDKNGIQL